MARYSITTPQFGYSIDAADLQTATEKASTHAPPLKRGWTLETEIRDTDDGPRGVVRVRNSRGRVVTGCSVREA